MLDHDDLDAVRERERHHFDELWGELGEAGLHDLEAHFTGSITPAHLPGGTLGGLTHLRAYRVLTAEGIQDRDVLDYACGLGLWSLQLAKLGARVSGFDLSEVGIDYARRRAAENEVDVAFEAADAEALPYADASFDLVVGIGVLHHVVKYPRTASELRRVMRPGAVAVFTENLGHNPFIELARKVTMRNEKEAGDVILTEPLVRSWAGGFSACEIEPYSLTYMVKRLTMWRPLLRLLYAVDTALLRTIPRLRRYCGECVVILRA